MVAQQSSKSPQSDIFVEDTIEAQAWENRVPPSGRTLAQPTPIGARVRDHDWIASLLIAACDVVSWVLLYGLVGYVRRDAFFVSPFEFLLVDCITFLVILQALFIVGGYPRNTETPRLT